MTKEMKKVAKSGKKIIRREVSKEEALEMFKDDQLQTGPNLEILRMAIFHSYTIRVISQISVVDLM